MLTGTACLPSESRRQHYLAFLLFDFLLLRTRSDYHSSKHRYEEPARTQHTNANSEHILPPLPPYLLVRTPFQCRVSHTLPTSSVLPPSTQQNSSAATALGLLQRRVLLHQVHHPDHIGLILQHTYSRSIDLDCHWKTSISTRASNCTSKRGIFTVTLLLTSSSQAALLNCLCACVWVGGWVGE